MANPEGAKAREPYQNFDGDDQSSKSTKPLARSIFDRLLPKGRKKDWRGVGEWSEAPSYEEGVGVDGR